jgi:hypothetical protein
MTTEAIPMAEDEEERICRSCFDGEDDGPLVSPCNCAGGQKYVHMKCLRQWQRMVLVTQPTHPQFYDRDFRHQTCNVCKAEFTCPPPTRHELMASFTGPEIAALIDAGCIIASHEAFSGELERQLEGMPSIVRRQSSYDHWIRGVFLITAVETGDTMTIPVDSQHMLESLRSRMGDDLAFTLQERRLHLASTHSLDGVAREDLAEAFANLTAPCTISLRAEGPDSCGHDHVVAVNLTRPIPKPPRSHDAEHAMANVCAKYRGASQVQVTHFIGGPCDENSLSSCLVLGGGGCGWTVVKELQAAIELAYTRSVKRCDAQGEICGGQTVGLRDLKACPELNGEIGIALRFVESSGRWLVRLRNGEGKQLKPANLEGLEGAGGRVFAVWGDARWSRTQLLGEIAKGDWGLCRANIGDLAAGPAERWHQTAGRLAFAPITEMSESYMRQAQQEMNAARARAEMHAQGEPREAED